VKSPKRRAGGWDLIREASETLKPTLFIYCNRIQSLPQGNRTSCNNDD